MDGEIAPEPKVRAVSYKRLTVLLLSGVLLIAVVWATTQRHETSKQGLLLFGPETNLAVLIELRGAELLFYQGRTRGSEPARYPFNSSLEQNVVPPMVDPKSNVRYTITGVSRYRTTSPEYDSFFVNVKIDEPGKTSYEQYADVPLRPLWRAPGVAHFHGPLTIGPQTVLWEIPSYVQFVRGGKTNDLRSYIGTMDPTAACWTVVKVQNGTNSAFPAGVFPYAEIEFPSLDSHQLLPKQRFPLQDFC